jgi:hypothetical protein
MRDRRRQRVLVKHDGHVRTQMADRELGLVVMPEHLTSASFVAPWGTVSSASPG